VVEDADVGRLDVPVDDARRMSVPEAFRDRDEDLDLASEGHRFAALDLPVEVFAGQKLLDDVGNAVLDAEVVDGRDVAMMEVAGELGLAEKPVLDLVVVDLAGLDRDRPLDEGVAAAVDGAEAAHTDLLGDLVFSDFFEHRPAADPPSLNEAPKDR